MTDSEKSETTPNSAHVDDPDVVSDKRLDSPPIYIYTDEAELHFQQLTEFCEGAMASITMTAACSRSRSTRGHFRTFRMPAAQARLRRGRSSARKSIRQEGWTFRSHIGGCITEADRDPASGRREDHRAAMAMGSSGLPSAHWSLRLVDRFDSHLRRGTMQREPGPGAPRCRSSGKRGLGARGDVDVRPYYYNDRSGTIMDLVGVAVTITGLDGPGGYDYKLLGHDRRPMARLLRAPWAAAVFQRSLLHLSGEATRPVRPAHHWDADAERSRQRDARDLGAPYRQ